MKSLLFILFTLTVFNSFGQQKSIASSAGFGMIIPNVMLVEPSEYYGDTVLLIDFKYGNENATISATMDFSKYSTASTLKSMSDFQFEDGAVSKESERTFNGNTGTYITMKGRLTSSPDETTAHYFFCDVGEKTIIIYVLAWKPNKAGLEAAFESILNTLVLR